LIPIGILGEAHLTRSRFLAEAAYYKGDLAGSRDELLEAIRFACQAKLQAPLFVALLYLTMLNVIESV
jgi:hypothetical protein